ncbi:MAG: primosomal protein N' [Saprospiraceae bacterium]|nr:primosomal protein N' [Saprospiraceae bacterium]
MDSTTPKTYAELILPLSLAGTFTYEIPEIFKDQIKIGCRVEVEFGKRKHYAALVKAIHDKTHWSKTKTIISIIDQEPIITSKQFEFWDWMSSYYVCNLGDVMSAALPASFKLQSETMLYKILEESNYPMDLDDDCYMILEALEIRNELSISEVQTILQKKSVLKLINQMVNHRWIAVRERLEDKASIATTSWIRIHSNHHVNKISFHEVLDQVQRSEKQTRSLLTYLQQKKDFSWIQRKDLQKISTTETSVTDAMLKKGIYEECVLDRYEYPNISSEVPTIQLSREQEISYQEIKTFWKKQSTVLFHGITGSGKTIIYLKLIKDCLQQNKQVLYLVPEIALTSQLVLRIKKYLGDNLLEYHSDLSIKSKAAVWNAALTQNRVFIGARSSIFLPFCNIGLIIIDEEHDVSYKQTDPAPRYQARDASMVLSKLFKANVLLGSATPSLESYYNAQQGKYEICKLESRFGDSVLPEMIPVSMKEASQFGKLKGFFTQQLLDAIKVQLELKKQIIIFRNRRGYSPLIQCSNCSWEATCDRCDVRMTLHKLQDIIKCHICGNQKPIPTRCPDCGQSTLRILGFGTEKIEEELHIFFPEIVIKRLDLDIARSRKIQQNIIESFQEKEIDILVGTQMITKGLDFDHVGLVGILQADQILMYPDFRAQERAFQLFTQVSGRAGRRKDRGLVLIQGYNIYHPVIQQVIQHDHQSFYQSELFERKKFKYPPYVRLIKIQILHLKIQVLEDGIEWMAKELRNTYGKRIIGPAEPHLSRIKGSYVRELLIKIEKDSGFIHQVKSDILRLSQELKSKQGFGSLRIQIDVDP